MNVSSMNTVMATATTTSTATANPQDGASAISIFGLGYVGCVSAACFASRGRTVIGVDVNPEKTAFLAAGKAPVVEERIGELTAEQVDAGRLTVSAPTPAAPSSTASLTGVRGNTLGSQRSLSTIYLERATEQIGAALATKDSWHVVVYPQHDGARHVRGPARSRFWNANPASGWVSTSASASTPSSSARAPASGTSWTHPRPSSGRATHAAATVVMALYDGLPGPRFQVPIAVAEMTKYVDNSFHALKVGFANEIGAICASPGPGLPRGDGHLPRRHQAEHQPRLPAARVSPSVARACPRTFGRSPHVPGSTTSTSRCCPSLLTPTRRTCAVPSIW